MDELRMFVTFDNDLPCHCEPLPSLSLRAKRGNPVGSPPRLLRPDKSGLATTEAGYTDIAEPVLKRKQGISLLATTEKSVTRVPNGDTHYTELFRQWYITRN